MELETIMWIVAGVLLLICIILAILSSVIFVKLNNLSDIVQQMQTANEQSQNQSMDFHIRRPNPKPAESEHSYGNFDIAPGEELSRRGFSQNPPPRSNNPAYSEDRYVPPQNQSGLYGNPGRKDPPKSQPKNVVAQNDNYLNPNVSDEPFRKSSNMSYMSDDVFRKGNQMENNAFRKGSQMQNNAYGKPSQFDNNSSKPRSNMENNNFFY